MTIRDSRAKLPAFATRQPKEATPMCAIGSQTKNGIWMSAEGKLARPFASPETG
jgi:hypothetical protein